MSDPVNQRRPFSIGHAAKMGGVSVSTLRSWESLGLVQPHKSESGHRSFSSEDIDRIRRIEQLRRIEGQSLSAIRKKISSDPLPKADDADEGKVQRLPIDYNKIGAKVREMRKLARMSLRDLSVKTDITVSHLSMFERGAAFLSPARLSAVADVFGKSLAELLGGTSNDNLPFVRKGGGRIVGTFGPGVSIEQVTVAERMMDVELWTIESGRESDGFYSHDGEELLHVLSGELEVTLGARDPVLLRSGDSAYFSSSTEHRWRNPGAGKAVVLWVNTDSARASAMQFRGGGRRLELGTSHSDGLGEGALDLQLQEGCETYRVMETHTAGHPTRILIEALEGLDGETAAEKAEAFREKYDHLRNLLLQEPRGHTGSFGLIPFASQTADFGAFFITSYGYPSLCGHAIFGYAKALSALNRLEGRTDFTIEMPGATVAVKLRRTRDEIDVEMPGTFVLQDGIEIEHDGRTFEGALVGGGSCQLLIDCDQADIDLNSENLDDILSLGAALKQAYIAKAVSSHPPIDNVLLFRKTDEGTRRLFLAIDRHRYDRSPGVTGLSACMALEATRGTLDTGHKIEAESIFGGRLSGEIISIAKATDGRLVCVPNISGRAHLNGVSTLIVEPEDPLKRGFLGT
jgi:proline racemase|nr:proline racemase family protein [Oricola indica]